jgi:AcrR family transcriptional regulator
MELLLETELLEILAPEIVKSVKDDSDGEEAVLRRARFWGYLAALDRSSALRPVPPSNALLLAVIVLPRLRDALDPDSNGVRDVGQLVAQAIAPALDRLRPSRKDSEIARQILLALRNILPSKSGRKRSRPPWREFVDDALRLAEIVSSAESTDATIVGRPIIVEGAPPPAEAELEAEGEDLSAGPPPESFRHRDHGRHGGRGGRGGRGGPPPDRVPPAPAPMDLGTLAAAARSLTLPVRPTFLGNGAFGGPWNSRTD